MLMLHVQAHDEDAIVATVARSVLAVVSELQRAAPKAGILLMGLLPRGDRLSSDADVFKQPSKYVQSSLHTLACRQVSDLMKVQ